MNVASRVAGDQLSQAWLGDVPASWKRLRAKYLFRDIADRNHSNEPLVSATQANGVVYRDESDLRVWNPGDDVSQYKLVHPGDFVISLRSFQGGLERSEISGILSPAYTVARPNGGVRSKFFKHLLKSPGVISALNVSTTGIRQGKNIAFSDFAKLELPVPPSREQDTIGEYLDTETARIDALIDRKQRFIDLLLEKRTALITHAVTKGLNPSAETKDSGIEWTGEIATSMRVTALKHLLLSIVDTEHKTAPFHEEGDYLVCRTTNVRDGVLRLEGAKFTDRDGYREWTQRAVPIQGDIVFTREAPAGEACVVPDEPVLCLGQRTVLFKVNPGRLDSRYAVYSLYGGPARQYINLLSQGSTVAHFNMSDIGTIPLTVPAIDEQRAIADFLDTATRDIDLVAQRTRRSIDLLREYRTALISAAVTGQIDIPGTETSEDVA